MSDPHNAIERRLAELESKSKDWRTVICDACPSSLTLSASASMDLGPHLLRTALSLGWELGDSTIVGLGGSRERKGLASDLCPVCVAKSDETKPMRKAAP